MAKLEQFEVEIREKVEKEHWTHARLSSHLKAAHPGERGFSVRSIEKFCSENDIYETAKLSDVEVDDLVAEAIDKVGPTYGRKTMTGLLASGGVKLGEQRVGRSLARINPSYHVARQTATARQMNPVPYRADYFGHKLHIDQNEKCVMYGVTHVCAVDGYSGKIVGFITMPVKNNVEIYTHLFRSITLQYGLWDQLRVDHGKEWTLMLFIQEELASWRRSKLNHCVERLWVEMNGRVSYPIKTCLVHLEAQGDIDMMCSHTKFCVSWFTIKVCTIGTTLAVSSWNEHPIPGHNRGVPNRIMANNNQVASVPQSIVPDPDDAVGLFQSGGGRLTLFSSFGHDPLCDNPQLIEEREQRFRQQYPDFGPFFYTVVNGDYSLFRDGLLNFIRISQQLQSMM